MARKHPQYKISQWIDTSHEALSKPQATLRYGVQIKNENGSRWLHCYRDNEPLIFDTMREATAAIDQLKKADDLTPNKI